MVIGLVLAQRYDTPGGATMAAVSVALFFAVLLVQTVRARLRPRTAATVLAV